jgi:hypothetical protein
MISKIRSLATRFNRPGDHWFVVLVLEMAGELVGLALAIIGNVSNSFVSECAGVGIMIGTVILAYVFQWLLNKLSQHSNT